MPSISGYAFPADFAARLDFPTGETIEIRTAGASRHSSGVLFEGERSSLWVDRETVEGPAADDLRSNPLPGDAVRLHSSPAVTTLPTVRHLTDFYEVVRGSSSPVSDAETAHTTNVALHLANISIQSDGRFGGTRPPSRLFMTHRRPPCCPPLRRTGYELVFLSQTRVETRRTSEIW